jgi:predicted amidohydrolase YtcJ
MLKLMTSPATADWVFRGGVVYTCDAAESTASAVAVKNGRIIFVGSSEGVKDWIGPKTEVVELNGRMVMPGFHDSHIHPLMGGVNLIECSLAGLETLPEYLDHIRRYAAERTSKPFIRGYGWVHGHFPPIGPSKKDLDVVVPDRPALFKAMDGHSAWVNSKALEAAHITRETPDPPGGKIERDPSSGEPAGTLREWSAMDLVKDVFPPPDEDELAQGLRAFMAQAAQMGITAVHDAMVSDSFLRVYERLDAQGELTLWVSASLLCEPESGSDFLGRAKEMRQRVHGKHVQARTVKFFMDGVMESHTACLLEPYTDRPGFHGKCLWSPEAFRDQVTALDQEGFQLHIHAIGDGAVRLALDSLQPTRRDARHMLAHLDLISRADIPRLAALGLVANVQPAWFYIDNGFFDTALPYLGSQRAQGMYPVKSLLQAGAILVCSSDWPFGGDSASFNPLEAITVGRTRRGIGGHFLNPMTPEECLDLSDLLKAYTRMGAWAAFREQETGTLEVGKAADLIVLDGNLFERPPACLYEARVLLTLFEGRVVHRDPSI